MKNEQSERFCNQEARFQALRTRDLQFLKQATREDLSSWFLKNYAEGDTGFKSVDTSLISVVTQFRIMFDASDEATQRKITGALGDAIYDWRVEANTGKNLFNLVCAAGESEARETIPTLIWLVQSHELGTVMERDHMSNIPVMDVLSGFAPEEDVKEAFNRWGRNPDVNPKFAGHIMVGRAVCDPDKYPTFLRDFWASGARIPGYFIHDGVYFSLIYDQGIGVDTFISHMDEFTPEERRKMLSAVTDDRFVRMFEKNGHLMFHDKETDVTHDCGALS